MVDLMLRGFYLSKLFLKSQPSQKKEKNQVYLIKSTHVFKDAFSVRCGSPGLRGSVSPPGLGLCHAQAWNALSAH